MRNRNQHRLLNDEQIQNIKAQVAYDLVRYADDSSEAIVDCYLSGDSIGLFEIISDWVECAEDSVLNEINTQLNEESYKQNYQQDVDD